jgi:hypothetical protein
MLRRLESLIYAAEVLRGKDKMKRMANFAALLMGGFSLLQMKVMIFAAVSLGVLGLWGATIDVPVTLKAGWNAIYVPCGVEGDLDEVFKDWPVPSVSVYQANRAMLTETTAGGVTGESEAKNSFLIWSREVPAASSLEKLVGDSVLVCCNTSGVEWARGLLRGVPVAPRVVWHKTAEGGDTYNYVGVRLNEGASVKASAYFGGCAVAEGVKFYKLAGTTESGYKVTTMGGISSSAVAKLGDGQVVLVPGKGASEWSGPLYVTPREGIEFGKEEVQKVLEVRNDGAEEKKVTMKMVASTTAGDEALVVKVRNTDETVINTDWAEMAVGGKVLEKVLATGEVWRVTFAIDRRTMGTSGKELGAIVEICEVGGTEMRVDVPVTAVDWRGEKAWPCGLWALDLELDKVTRYVKDTQKVDDVKAGGVMKLRIYTYVDEEGVALLLPRLTVCGVKNSNFTVTRTVYGPEANLPKDVDYGRRLTSAALPVDMGVVAGEAGSSWGKSVKFKYTIGTKSGSNPFRHALHPMFDGKDGNFEELSYDGDDFGNYAKSVKPELFSIGGEVDLDWTSVSGEAWSPEDKMSGDCAWIYTGLMRQGPVKASGKFTAQRVVSAVEFITK